MSKNAATMELLRKHRKDFVDKHAAEYQANEEFEATQKAKSKELATKMASERAFVGDAGTHIVGDPNGAFGMTGAGGALHGMGVRGGGVVGGVGPHGGPHGPGGPGGR